MAKRQNAHVQSIVDRETGEEIRREEVYDVPVPSEPEYVKLYLGDLVKLHDLPGSSSNILYELLKFMDYTNSVIVIAARRREICNSLGIQEVTFKKALTALVQADVLIKKERSLFLFNPNLFGRGPWNNIRKLRLELQYSKAGREVSVYIDDREVSLKDKSKSKEPSPVALSDNSLEVAAA